MEKVFASGEIKVPASKVFDYITNPKNIPAILPGLIENSNIPELPLKSGSSFNYKYQMYGMTFDGVWTVLEIQSPTLYKAHTTGGIASDWTIEISEADNMSKIQLTVEYEIPGTLFKTLKSTILRKINENEATHMLENLKTVLESE